MNSIFTLFYSCLFGISEYLDEEMLIPKNTSVLIRRVPGRPRLPIVTEIEYYLKPLISLLQLKISELIMYCVLDFFFFKMGSHQFVYKATTRNCNVCFLDEFCSWVATVFCFFADKRWKIRWWNLNLKTEAYQLKIHLPWNMWVPFLFLFVFYEQLRCKPLEIELFIQLGSLKIQTGMNLAMICIQFLIKCLFNQAT